MMNLLNVGLQKTEGEGHIEVKYTSTLLSRMLIRKRFIIVLQKYVHVVSCLIIGVILLYNTEISKVKVKEI